MGEFRHRDGKLVIVVSISLWLCNYVHNSVSVELVLSHFPMFPVITSGYLT